MKTKAVVLFLISFVGIIVIFGFSRDRKKDSPGKYVFVPMGSTQIGGETISMDSYWISDHEITNMEYNEFLADIKANGRNADYQIAKADTANWSEVFRTNSGAYAAMYHWHPAYNYYPALNISHAGAKLYCEWLTSKSEEENVEYRLPTKNEWLYAAKGGLEHATYSWGGPSLRNKKGLALCNYRKIGDEAIHTSADNSFEIIIKNVVADNLAIAAPVKSYSPNDYGLYNTCGNVAEMISEEGVALGGSWYNTGYDVRLESVLNYDKPSPLVGFRPVKIVKK